MLKKDMNAKELCELLNELEHDVVVEGILMYVDFDYSDYKIKDFNELYNAYIDNDFIKSIIDIQRLAEHLKLIKEEQ